MIYNVEPMDLLPDIINGKIVEHSYEEESLSKRYGNSFIPLDKKRKLREMWAAANIRYDQEAAERQKAIDKDD